MSGSLPILALAAALLAVIPARADSVATVDPAARGQILEGWGTSLCWWAHVVGGFPDAARRDYLGRIFDTKHGLGLNIVRYNIGGGENPDLPDSMEPRARMPGFEPSPGVWDWDADANQRRILLECRPYGVNVMEAFSNSPPYWMTISGSVTGAPDGGSNLKPEDYAAFADYLAEVVQHSQEAWGVTFQTLEPMNESANSWWKKGGKQEGCHFDARNTQGDDQNALVTKVAAALTRRGLSTIVSASDDNTIDTTLASLNAYDPQAQAAVGQINTHTYGGSKRAELKALAARLGRRVWVSEHGDGDATGLVMARDIVGAFTQLGATGWVYWQAVDGGWWGMLDKDNNHVDDFAYTLNEKYYMMGQYSRFLRPGDRFLTVGDTDTLAAYRVKSGTLTLVALNDGDAAKTVTYDLSRFAHVGGVAEACRTSATEHWAALPAPVIAGKQFTAAMPAKSVTTYVLKETY